jgi:peptide-methionine (R)-S-oxide reductase
MFRRTFLTTTLLGSASSLLANEKETAAKAPPAKDEKSEKVVKTKEEWKKQLTQEQYEVTREHSTERPFTNAYNANKKKGIYSCICCGQDLYSSEHKFDSGTGWPSFFQPIKEAAVGKTEDRKLFYTRVEVHCSKCDAHLGHVFDDATGKGSVPLTPTGLRYCMNSASMKFTEKK